MTLTAAAYRMNDSIGYLLTSTARTHERRLERLLTSVGITRIEFSTLVAIGREGISKPSDMAEALQVDKPTISRTLRSLEARGFVLSANANLDKRVRLVGLTKAGHDRMNVGIDCAVAVNARIYDTLSDEERAAFVSMLSRIAGAERPKLPRF